MGAQADQFAAWMRAHYGVLHRIGRAFAEPADQHDLVQELSIAVWRAIPAFRGGSQPVTFIYRVAHNRALTWRRRESGRRFRAAEADAEWARREPAGNEGEAALLEALYGAIRKLAPLDRSLVLLSLEGMPYGDIARLHELSETNVGARLSRARQRISALIEEDRHGL